MKIYLLTTSITKVGGLEAVTCKLGNGFISTGSDVEIINIYKREGEIKFNVDDRVAVTFLSDSNNRLIQAINVIKYLNTLESKSVVIGMGTYATYLLSISKPSIYKIGSQHHPIRYGILKNLVRRVMFSRLNKYTLLDDEQTELIIKNIGIKNVVTIPNPITIDITGITEFENNIILCVGRLSYEKGFDRAILVFSEFCKTQKNWELHIVGEGNEYSNLLMLCKELNIIDRVKFFKFTTNISSHYKNASIYLLTSRFEGFGLTIIEAQSHGLPVVAFDCPTGPRNLIKNGVNGLLINDGDIKECVSNLIFISNNKSLMKELGDEGKNSAKKYDTKVITKKWIDIIQ